MSESQTPGLLTISAECQLLRCDPPMWRYTLRNGNGTVIRTWETENAPSFLRLMSSPCEMGGQRLTPVVVCDETLSGPGGVT